MLPYKEEVYVAKSVANATVYLVGDIGGTNANFALFMSDGKKPVMIRSLHIKSRDIVDFSATVQDVLNHLHAETGAVVTTACFAAAGVVSEYREYSKPTNANFSIEVNSIKELTGLQCIALANDFEVIGYGLDAIDKASIIPIHRGALQKKGNKAILGAGTGLGKCILVWDKDRDYHIPVASEGGHADFAPHNDLEFELMRFIQESEQFTCPVSWEDVLSGNGIKRIYRFFKKRNKAVASSKAITEDGPHPDEIFNNRLLDDHSARTFELYSTLYARCAKNFALDALALGGVYIAGGIAAKNIPLFQQPAFFQEFVSCGKQHNLLEMMPVFVIGDYNVSLYGAFEYMRREGLCGHLRK